MPVRRPDPTNPYDVPDWADPAAYPKDAELTLPQWRWEFIRRSTDYRSAWLEWRELYNDIAVDGCLEGAIEDQFGIGAPIDPRLQAKEIADQTLIDYSASFIHWHNMGEHFSDEAYDEQGTLDNDDDLNIYKTWSLLDFIASSEGTILVSINPAYPLKTQFINAETLIAAQIERQGSLLNLAKNPKRRKQKQHARYSTYLRVLDARDTSNKTKPISWNKLQKALRAEKHGITATSLHKQATDAQRKFLQSPVVRSHLLTKIQT